MEGSSSRATKLSLKAFSTPLPRLGSIDAHELNALKNDRDKSSMDCPKCNERLLCDNCCRYYKGDPVFKAPGCEKCKKRYEKEIDDAKTELEKLRAILRDGFSKQILAYEDAQKKLNDRLTFLKLHELDSANDVLKGDVALVVHDSDPIYAHRFILAGKSPVFCRMFDCSKLEKQTGVIPIDDATWPVIRAVIDYCYTADISFTDDIPPEEVLRVAHKYQITHLRDVCGDELCLRINEKNVPEMLRLSKKYEAKTLLEAAAKYFKEHFDPVFSTFLEKCVFKFCDGRNFQITDMVEITLQQDGCHMNSPSTAENAMQILNANPQQKYLSLKVQVDGLLATKTGPQSHCVNHQMKERLTLLN